VTGVTLPLISAGGTSLVLTLFIVGLLVRFARSEPAAIEFERGRRRGRLARLLLPVPAAPVDPVRPRRLPEERGARSPAVSTGRTVVPARGGERRAPAPGRGATEPAREPGRRQSPASGSSRRPGRSG
ncbi:MAG: ftsW, partial [Blastococcus sp.]|nr:ftsW [Blastococcus sp.]